MFEIRITGSVEPIRIGFAGMAARLGDMIPLARSIRDIMIEDNRRDREAGLDRSGNPLAPLRGGRELTAKEIRRRGGDGPPLAPRGSASRVVADYDVAIYPVGDDGSQLIRGTWPSMPFLHYHLDGRGHNPPRDVAGVSPGSADAIEQAVRRFVADALGI